MPTEVKILMHNDITFFQKLDSKTGTSFAARFQALFDAGYDTDVSFYTVRVKKKSDGTLMGVAGMEVSTSSIMHDKATDEQLILVRKSMDELFSKVEKIMKSTVVISGSAGESGLSVELNTPEGKKEVHLASAKELTSSSFLKHLMDAGVGGSDAADTAKALSAALAKVSSKLAISEKPPQAKPSEKQSGVVALRFATKIGEKVRGTSPDSVYRVIALSDRIKMAVRVAGGNLSIRVEGNPTESEQQKMANFGISKAGEEHWSTHFEMNTVPVDRVIGALFFGLDIDFSQKVESGKKLGEVLG